MTSEQRPEQSIFRAWLSQFIKWLQLFINLINIIRNAIIEFIRPPQKKGHVFPVEKLRIRIYGGVYFCNRCF